MTLVSPSKPEPSGLRRRETSEESTADGDAVVAESDERSSRRRGGRKPESLSVANCRSEDPTDSTDGAAQGRKLADTGIRQDYSIASVHQRAFDPPHETVRRRMRGLRRTVRDDHDACLRKLFRKGDAGSARRAFDDREGMCQRDACAKSEVVRKKLADVDDLRRVCPHLEHPRKCQRARPERGRVDMRFAHDDPNGLVRERTNDLS